MGTKIKSVDLIHMFQMALNEHWGYIWGTAGVVWTAVKQDNLANKYISNPVKYADLEMSAEYGGKWINSMVADCSGMFAWAFKKLGGSIAHGSNSIWDRYCSSKGELKRGKRDDGAELRPGTAVFIHNKSTDIRGHIGLYIGDGEVIEAASTLKGVITSKITRWDEWGELKDVTYSDEVEVPTVMTLKRGSKGDAVKDIQEKLNKLGFNCGEADGVFGKKTEDAIKAFQAAYGIDVDGIAGPQTQGLLNAAADLNDITGPVATIAINLPVDVAKALKDALSKVDI